MRRWIDAYNTRDLEAEAAARAPGFLVHAPGARGPLDSEGWIEFAFGFAAAFPDPHLTAEDIFATEDMVAFRVIIRGTHQGPFEGVRGSGKQVAFTSIEINRMEDGKIAEHWGELDVLKLLRQIGDIPSPT